MATITLSNGLVALVDDQDARLADMVWSHRHGYAYRCFKTKGGWRTAGLHRFVLGVEHGGPPVDHINGNRLDCRRANLRLVSTTENSRNLAGASRRSKSGHLGVCWHATGKKWRATISAGGKPIHLGLHDTMEEAVAARIAAEKRLWGEQPRRKTAGVYQ